MDALSPFPRSQIQVVVMWFFFGVDEKKEASGSLVLSRTGTNSFIHDGSGFPLFPRKLWSVCMKDSLAKMHTKKYNTYHSLLLLLWLLQYYS
jgi:hypothetical protein